MDKLYLVGLIIIYLLITNYKREHFTLDKVIPIKNVINYGKDGINIVKKLFNNIIKDDKVDDTSECNYIKADNYNINYNYDISGYEKNNNLYFNNI